MGLLLLLLLGIVVGIYLVLFSLSNTHQVSLNLLGHWYLHEVAVWQLVVVCLGVGIAVAVLLLLPAQWRSIARARAYRGELRRAQAMLEEERRQRPAPAAATSPPSLPAAPTEEGAGGQNEAASGD